MRNLVILFACVFFAEVNAAYCPTYSAIVVDLKADKILHAYNADHRVQPASLTKMMTLLLTFKALREKRITLNTQIRFSNKAASQRPSVLGLKTGEYISMRDAILALITRSANDVAVAIAEHISGSEQKFATLMNNEAKTIGMSSTNFVNASGWTNSRQLTTARDIAKLSKTLLVQYSAYYHLFATKSFYYNGKSIHNHNHILGNQNDFLVDGIKTGFVNASGFNLAASAVKGDKRLIAVVLGGPTSLWRDNRVKLLLKNGFDDSADSNNLGAPQYAPMSVPKKCIHKSIKHQKFTKQKVRKKR